MYSDVIFSLFTVRTVNHGCDLTVICTIFCTIYGFQAQIYGEAEFAPTVKKVKIASGYELSPLTVIHATPLCGMVV